MATKKRRKEYTKADALAYFDDILKRIDANEYCIIDNVIYSTDDEKQHVIIIPESALADELKGDPRFTTTTPSTPDSAFLYDCGNLLRDQKEWNPIDHDTLYTGNSVYLSMDDRKLRFNKGLLPVKLRKAEFKDISYLIRFTPYPILAIRKVFPSKLDGFGVTLMKVFKIL